VKDFEEPTLPADAVLARISFRGRVRYAAAGLAGLTMALLVASLWATEQELPVRTHLAFAAIVVAGLVWAGFACWALLRSPLFARDRVVAGTLAVVFSGVAAAGMVTVTALQGRGVLMAVATGAVFVAGSVALLANARRRRAELLRRKEELSR
jgi:hypothetical protein